MRERSAAFVVRLVDQRRDLHRDCGSADGGKSGKRRSSGSVIVLRILRQLQGHTRSDGSVRSSSVKAGGMASAFLRRAIAAVVDSIRVP